MADKSKPTAFLGLLTSSKKKAPAAEPLDDETSGEEYSKVGDDLDEEPDEHGAAFAAFASAAGIPPARQARAQAALKQFIKACTRSDDYSDEE